ncbi:hypothetical protein VNO78_23974 [Psophocarpus tetragonolobus]|uniref:Uncharacterized protein n=1 Tax=Psophocarpus tetragonolobus TaxID=3891 RepID=A0AAN9XED3_PSOTE
MDVSHRKVLGEIDEICYDIVGSSSRRSSKIIHNDGHWKKWKEYRLSLFDKFYDDSKSREENIRNPPYSILAVEWAAFLDYRLDEKAKQMCKKNAENRAKLRINHTSGSKKLKRKMTELMAKTGQPINRGTLYIHTHKRNDGTYINEETRIVCEKISEIESEGTALIEVSMNDSLGQVFGKEHPGKL